MAWPVTSRRAREFKPMRRAQGGYLGAAMRAVLFGSTPNPYFNLSLQTSLNPERSNGSGTPTFTRASTAYQEDFEGKLNLVLSGESRFQGARRVKNLFATHSENFSSGWTLGTTVTVPTTNNVAPNGASTASNAVFAGGGNAGRLYQNPAAVIGRTYTMSFWVKSNTGASQTFRLIYDNTGFTSDLTATTSWQRFSATDTNSTGNGAYGVWSNVAADAYDLLVWGAQIEDVTGQSNQNPSEYVSVGVLSAPYHGANVDGVKYFSTLNGNTVASNVVTEATGAAINSSNAKFGVLSGVAGSYFSTPDSVANSITGDIDIRVLIAPEDWTPAVESGVVQKDDAAANREWQFNINTAAKPRLFWWETGGTLRNVTSSAAITSANSTVLGVRVTLDVNDGAGGHEVKFWTSPDFVTWTQLGTTQTAGVFTTSIRDQVAPVIVANVLSGLPGKTYRAQIYNGINGTLAVDFNPNLSTSAQTFTAATGEVWTTNGTARIFGNTNATYGIPAQWDAGGPFGYLAEGARADVLGVTAAIRRTMADVGWVNGGTMTVGAATGIDGVASAAASLTGGAVAATNTILYTTVLGASVKTYSAFVRRKTGSGTVSITGDAGVTWTPMTLTTAYKQFSFVTANVANPVVGFKIDTNLDAIEVDFNTLEVASFANPTPIPLNVSKAADVLTYPSAGNISGTVGSAYAEVGIYPLTVANHYILADAAANRTPMYFGSTGAMNEYDGTSAQAYTAAGQVVSAITKASVSWSGTAARGTVNGTAGVSGTLTIDGDFNFSANFAVGIDSSGTVALFGTIRNVRIYPVALPAAKMQSLTT